MKYLECTCCGFLAVIQEKDDHSFPCPFCVRTKCEHDKGKTFEPISSISFKNKAELK
jgi:hypothetical protein